jgi:hypothetical protein
MTPWQQLLASAIVGTDRLPALPALSEPPLLAQIAHREKESALLSSAVVVSIRRQAGWMPEEIPVGAGESPARQEMLPPLSRNAAHHLKALLTGMHAGLLPEFLKAADQAGRIVPAELLPRLLTHAQQQRHLSSLMTNVIGERGAWLIAHKSDWQYLETSPEPGIWEIGDIKQRVAWLARKRSEAPAEARSALEAVIGKEPAAVRAEFLSVLAKGLSMEDEPFLEQALDDKSKEVRGVAANLLGRLPESRWASRMCARAQTAVIHQAGGFLRASKLEIHLPKSLDNAMKRDGIDPVPYTSRKQLGERAAILMLIIGGVPPSYWEKTFGLTAEAILKLAKNQEWEQPLVSGWAMAATRFGNAAWAAAILAGDFPWSKLLLPVVELAAVLPAQEREAFLLRTLGGSRGIFAPSTPEPDQVSELRPMLSSFDQLPDKLADAILVVLKKSFSSDKPSWHGLSLLQELAPRISLAAAAQWIDALGQIPETNPHHGSVQKTADLLSFRIEMHRSIQETDL